MGCCIEFEHGGCYWVAIVRKLRQPSYCILQFSMFSLCNTESKSPISNAFVLSFKRCVVGCYSVTATL